MAHFTGRNHARTRTSTMHYRFSPPASESEWKAYHDIRRTVLFEARGRFGVYQANHPDEHAPENYPFLLFLDDQAIGVIRIDLPDQTEEAVFRRVAIVPEHQRQGHGTTLMREAEAFAAAHNRTMFIANVARDAVPFYEKLGYVLDPDPSQSDPSNPRMIKETAPQADPTPLRRPSVR